MDASGGSALSPGHLTGGISGKFGFIVPWGKKINCGVKDSDGKHLSRKLSALELVGPLFCINAHQAVCAGKPIRIWVDNAGSVRMWRKGYSTRCKLWDTLVKAIGSIAATTGCKVDTQKITCCSNDSSILADKLSKGRFEATKRKLPDSWKISAEKAWIPPSILKWIAVPQDDTNLAEKIMNGIRSRNS
jgi:hypothetical protein